MMAQYIQSNKYETTQLEGEWIVLNTDNFTVTKLNEIGGFCWSLLSEVQTVDTIIKAITDEYAEISSTVEASDIESFLSELMECGLVENVS